MTIREKEHLFPAIETISKYCKGHNCGSCEFYLNSASCCLFDCGPDAWGQILKDLEKEGKL